MIEKTDSEVCNEDKSRNHCIIICRRQLQLIICKLRDYLLYIRESVHMYVSV